MNISNISTKALQSASQSLSSAKSPTTTLFEKIKPCGHVVRALVQEAMLKQNGGIAFRGDTRAPSSIFAEGFQRRNCKSDSVVICYRPKDVTH